MALARTRSFGLLLTALCALGGCSTTSIAMLRSAAEMLPFGRAPAAAPPLDPQFEYLRITRGRRTGWMWLGSTEKSPNGPIEVYYSGQGEVLRLQNGRIVGASGLTTEWRRVSVEAPSWAAAADGAQVKVLRSRDIMPGYRSGVRDELVLHAVSAPDSSALRVLDAGKLKWFEERFPREPFLLSTSPEWLPPARYAVDLSSAGERVVYAEQCLAQDLCFAWQRWSAAMQSASTADGATR